MPEIYKPASRLYEAIEKTAPVDQGTSSTFRALADRGLIQIEEREYNVHGQPKPYIRLTQTGILSRVFRTPRTAALVGQRLCVQTPRPDARGRHCTDGSLRRAPRASRTVCAVGTRLSAWPLVVMSAVMLVELFVIRSLGGAASTLVREGLEGDDV